MRLCPLPSFAGNSAGYALHNSMISSTKYLEHHSFFAGLSARSRTSLGEISGIKSLIKNELLFREGEKGFACGVLIRGSPALQDPS